MIDLRQGDVAYRSNTEGLALVLSSPERKNNAYELIVLLSNGNIQPWWCTGGEFLFGRKVDVLA